RRLSFHSRSRPEGRAHAGPSTSGPERGDALLRVRTARRTKRSQHGRCNRTLTLRGDRSPDLSRPPSQPGLRNSRKGAKDAKIDKENLLEIDFCLSCFASFAPLREIFFWHGVVLSQHQELVGGFSRSEPGCHSRKRSCLI